MKTGLIKICGITNAADAQMALKAGAGALGFVFYAKSPRYIDPRHLAEWIWTLPPGCLKVGVFVDPSVAWAYSIAERCGLSVLQIHGSDAEEAFSRISIPLWRALPCGVGGVADSSLWPRAECHVIDAAVAGMHGGTGVLADWEQARCVARKVPVVLAGGLTAGNVAAAIAAVSPCGVDVSSAVEVAPGCKDAALVSEFIARARDAFDCVDRSSEA